MVFFLFWVRSEALSESSLILARIVFKSSWSSNGWQCFLASSNNASSWQEINPPTFASTSFHSPKLPTKISAYFPSHNLVPIDPETSKITRQLFLRDNV